MKFREWYDTQKVVGEIDPEMVEDAWNACKKEVLGILIKHSNHWDSKLEYIQKTMEEIEKL